MSQSPWEPKQDPLEQALRMAAKKIKSSGGPPKKVIIGLVIVFLVVVGGQSAFYKVDTEETGVLLRLGKSIGTASPGLPMKNH